MVNMRKQILATVVVQPETKESRAGGEH
jgi:hypothetical protein